VLATMTIALAATLMGRGPFILMDGGLADRVLALQAFLAICFYMSVPIAVQRHRSMVASVLLEAAHDETRAAEAKYRRIAESTVDLIAQSDLEGRLTYVSPSCSSLGFAPERLVGSLSVDGLHPDDRARFVELRSRLLSEGVEPPRGDWRFRIRCASWDY